MPERIPQSTTIRVPLYAVLSSDHISPATGKTIAITISKNGAAFGNPSGGATNATEIASGWYYVDLSTTDTGTLGPLIILGTQASIDNSTIAYNVAVDAVNLIQVNGHAVTDTASGVLDVNAKNLGGTAQTGRDIGASVLLSAGSGTGQLDFTSGVVKANATQWLGGTIPAVNVTGVPLVDLKYTLGTLSAGAAGYVGLDWGHITAPTTAVGLSGTTIATSQVVASVSGAVGSVTGAVGSVTGNVGGNVVGSVASVTARVTANTDQWAGGTIPAPNVTGVPLVDIKYTLGTLSAGDAGYMGIDWSKITNPTATVALTNTTINSTSGTVSANVTQILGVASAGAPGYMGIDWAHILHQSQYPRTP